MEESKKKGNKKFKMFIIIFIIAILFFSKKENQEKLIEILNSIKINQKTLKLIESFPVEEDVKDLDLYDKNIMKWRDNKLSFLELDGTLSLEKEFNLEEPYIFFGEKYIYGIDKSSGDIYFLDKKGETINRIQLKTQIFNIKESHSNLILHIRNLNMESINILDKDGNLIGNNLVKDRNILTYSTNKDGSKYVLSLLNLKEGAIKSQIEIFDINGEKLASIDLEKEIVVNLEFTDNEEVIILTDKGLYYIKDNKILWKKQFDLIKDIYLDKDKIYVLYSNYLESIYFDGRTKSKMSFSEEYKKILSLDKHIFLYGDKYIVGIQDEKEILKYESDEKILGLYGTKSNLMIWNPNKVNIFSITNKK